MWHFHHANLMQVTEFCNSDHNDPIAPNKNNYWCRNRSVQTVIDKSVDIRSKTPLDEDTNTTPTFRYISATSQPVYIVLDVSTHGSSSISYFDQAKTKITEQLNLIRNERGSTLVRILTMGGTAFNTNSGLGGYLNSVTETLEVRKYF